MMTKPCRGLERLILLLMACVTLCVCGESTPAEGPRAELSLSLGHASSINCVALSEDGKYVLTASNDMTVMLWDVDMAWPIQTFKGHTGWVKAVAMSEDGKRIFTGSADRTAILWDTKTGTPIRIFKNHTQSVTSVAMSPDGKFVLTGSGLTARLWDVKKSKPIRIFKGHTKAVSSVAISRDSKHVLTGSDQTARLYSVKKSRPIRTFKGHTQSVTSVAISRDGRYALTGAADNAAKLWRADTGKLIRTFEGHTNWVRAVAMSPDGQRILTGSNDGTARLWNAQTGEMLLTCKGHTARVYSVSVSEDGNRLLTASGDRTARLWNAYTGKTLRTFKGRTEPIRSVATSPDGKLVLMCSADNAAILWDVETAKPIRIFKGFTNRISSAAMSPDGQYIVTGANDGTAMLWDAQTGKTIQTFKGHTNLVCSVTISRDGKRIVTGSYDKTAKMWDAETGKPIHTFTGHTGLIFSVTMSEDGKRALTGSADTTAILWDAQTGKPIQTFKGHPRSVNSVAMSRDGKYVLTASGQTARLWEIEKTRPIQTFKGHSGLIFSVAMSPDARYALTGSADNTARLWDVETGKTIQTVEGHTAPISSVTFAQNKPILLTASDDGTVRIWKRGRDEPVFSILAANDEWICWTSEGYYSCSANGENLIAWKIKDDSAEGDFLVSPEQFRNRFHRRDLFRHLLAELDLTKALARAARERGRKPERPARMLKALPPGVVITQPRPSPTTIKTEEYQIAAKAHAVGDNSVVSLQLLIDGRPTRIARFKPAAARCQAKWTVKRPAGKSSRLQVVAESIKGSMGRSEVLEIIRVDEPETQPKLFLLGVGVSAYNKAALRKNVEYTGNDVNRCIDAQLTHGKRLYKDAEKIILTDAKPTRAEILDAFEELSKKARGAKKAVTMIFLAGHGKVDGQGNFYFLAADSDPDKLPDTAISAAELKDKLKKIPGDVIVFLDACHSGAFASLTSDLVSELSAYDCGVVVICSSRGNETSKQSSSLKAGYFTQAVVEGLSGKAEKDRHGAVCLHDLVDYVCRRVKDLSKREQRPDRSPLTRIGNLPLTRP